MNREETHALFAQGKEAWNMWAETMLRYRKQLETDAQWIVERNWSGLKGQNDATSAWLDAASVDFSNDARPQSFDTYTNFDKWIFPGTTNFRCAHFANATFKAANFLGDVDFAQSFFSDSVSFENCQFEGTAIFNELSARRHLSLKNAMFLRDASFVGAKFAKAATLEGSQAIGAISFDDACFSEEVSFDKMKFSQAAFFRNAKFMGPAGFITAKFLQTAHFENSIFSSFVLFREANFHFGTYFDRSVFLSDADFTSAVFTESAHFNNSSFKNGAMFANAAFYGNVWFDSSTFDGYVVFARCRFHQSTSFAAIRAERAFSIDAATFEDVPNFIQAKFSEAPRLDNAAIGFPRRPSMTRNNWMEPEALNSDHSHRHTSHLQACYRALKRLAAQGHDTDRELEFFAGEIKAARLDPRTEIARVTLGWLYEIFSDFGRSAVRPAVFWVISIGIFAIVALFYSPTSSYRACVEATEARIETIEDGSRRRTLILTGLPEPVARQTNALTEALQVAIRNGLITFDAGSDSAARSFGCLYGLARIGSSFAPIVPPGVSLAITIQKLFSAVMIFLFGLALRNMLKMK